jgi:hypothetical protein
VRNRVPGGELDKLFKMKGASACPLRAIKMETPIPITIPVTYNTYARLYSQGLLASYLCEIRCPKYPHDCGSQQPPPALEQTNTSVDRSALLLEKDDYDIDTVVKHTLKIVLVKCPLCKSRYRLLPADILPHKLYSLPVIELCVSLYNRGDLSLRQVVWGQLYGEHTPEHTTLHGWTEGLAAWWLGRPIAEVAFSVPATRVLAELQIRFAQTSSLHSIPVGINPQRYRSQGRCERLQACKRFEIISAIFGVKTPYKFCELNRLIISWGNWFGLGFKTGICCTAIELIDSTDVRSWRKIFPKEPLSCQIHGRSPPFGSK